MGALDHLNKRGFTSVGSAWKMVLIEDVDTAHGIAMCIDNWGKHMPVPLRVRRAKGPLPRIGELWMIDQSVGGRWTFSAIITENPEQIEGFVAQDFVSPIDTMANQGLVQDQTVAVDVYPWMVDIDTIATPGLNSHWGAIAIGLASAWSRVADGSAAWVQWPVVLGTGHWKIEAVGYVGDGPYPGGGTVTYAPLSTMVISLDGTSIGSISGETPEVATALVHRGSKTFDVAVPGRHDLRLATTTYQSLYTVRLIKTAQL